MFELDLAPSRGFLPRLWLEQGSSDSCHADEFVQTTSSRTSAHHGGQKYEKRDVLLLKFNSAGVKITVRSADEGRDCHALRPILNTAVFCFYTFHVLMRHSIVVLYWCACIILLSVYYARVEDR